MERTLIIFKPDAVQRALVGEILTRFERVGLKIIGSKMLKPDYDHYYHHYENIGTMVSRHGKEIFDITLEMMQQGPVIAFVLEGVDAVEIVRKLVGATEPKSAIPGTIRGDYAHVNYAQADKKKRGIPNLIHASGDSEEAKKEITHWFKEDELFTYSRGHDVHTHVA
jgi:nucleoside-diphosphate kinase